MKMSSARVTIMHSCQSFCVDDPGFGKLAKFTVDHNRLQQLICNNLDVSHGALKIAMTKRKQHFFLKYVLMAFNASAPKFAKSQFKTELKTLVEARQS